MQNKIVTVVIPVFEEEELIYDNIMVIKNTLVNTGYSFKIIIVDDGSKDKSWIGVKNLASKNDSISGIRFSRNFGKEAAICAGLEKAGGDVVIIMDADLQHPPDKIPEMLALWGKGYEIVDCVKKTRGKEKTRNAVSAGLFYSILNKFSGINLKNASDYKLMDMKAVNAYRKLTEKDTFFRGMSFWLGFKRAEVQFNVAPRSNGRSKWSILALARLAVTAIASFSSAPLQIVTCLGFIFLAGSLVLGIHTLYMKFSGMAVSGFTTVILLLLIIGSVIMISLGIIGTYISRIYDEVKARPRYIISEETE